MGIFSRSKELLTKEFSFYNDVLKNIILKKVDNRYINFSRSLEIFGTNTNEKCVYLGENNTNPLWGIEISKEGTEEVAIGNFEQLVKNHAFRKESKMTLFYVKRPIIDDDNSNFYIKESIYLFSYSRRLLEDIAFEFDIELMEVDKIMQSLYDIGLINNYEIDKNTFALKSRFHFTKFPKDELNNLYFKSVYAEGVYGALVKNENPQERNYHLYQGLCIDGNYLAGNPDLYRLFQEEWSGYIALNINLHDKDAIETFEDTNGVVQFGEKNADVKHTYSEIGDNLREMIDLSATCNIVAVLDNEKSISRISSILNVQFVPKHIGAKNIIYSTPLLERASAYDFFTPVSNVGKWVKSIHKKHNVKSRTAKQMYGRDVSYNFINYSWSETGDSLHWAIVAPTRSGKTFTILKIIQSAIGAVIEPKSEAEILHNQKLTGEFGEVMTTEKVVSAPKLGKSKIVHFDTGNSGLAFVTELKRRYPSKVFISKENINQMRFGLLNIKYDYSKEVIDDGDFLFSASVMNLILSLNGTEVINGTELSELRQAITRIFKKDDYKGETIRELENIGGYEDTIGNIYRYAEEKGIKISKNSRTTELNLRDTPLDYIQKPTMAALLKEIGRKAENYAASEDEKNACKSLATKLKVVEGQDMFAYYDKNNIEECDYYYMELGQLKELGERFFLPAYMITLRRLYRRDSVNAQRLKEQGKPVPAIIYVMEEVHNFIKIELLEDYFEKITREASRYQIYFGFITQMPKDIPSAILANIGSRMVLSSNKVTKTDLLYYWGDGDEKNDYTQQVTDFYSRKKRKYLTFINSGNGIVTIQQKVTSNEERLFNSNGEADLAEEIEDVA